MSHKEILDRIKEITERGIAYATAHATEIEDKRIASFETAERRIAEILESTESAQKHSWNIFESIKSQISAIAPTHEQYENAIIELTRILCI